MEKVTTVGGLSSVTNHDLFLGAHFPNSDLNISKYLILSLFLPY